MEDEVGEEGNKETWVDVGCESRGVYMSVKERGRGNDSAEEKGPSRRKG